MIKSEILDMMRSKGKEEAKVLQNKAVNHEITDTEIIHNEEKVPQFIQDKDYSNWRRYSPVQDNGQVWILLQPYNSKSNPGRPETLRALWGLAHTKIPEEAKEFVAPYGTSGMYMKDECAVENGIIYICKNDNTVQAPSVYQQGWTKYNG